ncbi:MAG: lipopolysaccharide heptosyltransferase II [Vicinamibacterales bacterium]
MDSLLVVAPNWLGDAVMALPAIGDVARAHPGARLTVAARSSVAPLFTMVDGVASVVTLRSRGGLPWPAAIGEDAAALAAGGYDAALLLPNAFQAAWLVHRAGVPERWGLATDMRARLLTRAVAKPRGRMHQAEYYQALVRGLGFELGPCHAQVQVSPGGRTAAASTLASRGLAEGAPYVAMAPGAAYGRAKQWLPERFAALATRLAVERGTATVLVGSAGDAPVCAAIARAVTAVPDAVNLAGETDIPALAGVLAAARAVVANDSGAMHLASAVGAPVAALFGATDERRTAPLPRGLVAPVPAVLTGQAWCRPCLLRECPIDHRCMRSLGVEAVFARVAAWLDLPPGDR